MRATRRGLGRFSAAGCCFAAASVGGCCRLAAASLLGSTQRPLHALGDGAQSPLDALSGSRRACLLGPLRNLSLQLLVRADALRNPRIQPVDELSPTSSL